MKEVTVLSQKQFEEKVLPKLNEFKDAFFISILDPDDKYVLHENTENFRTWKFYDIEHDINSYKAISYDQAKEICDFIKQNYGKKLIVHCHAGCSRSPAIGEFYWEMLGGSYKQFTEKFPHTLPNGRVLQLLRIAEKSEKESNIKINFV